MPNDQKNEHLNPQHQTNEQLIFELSTQVELLVDRGAEDATEQVLRSRPEIGTNDELTMSLLYAEIVAAEKDSRTPSEASFISRFPGLGERISRLFAFHLTLKSDEECDQFPDLESQRLGDNTDAAVSLIETDHDTKIASSGFPALLKQIEKEGFEILEKIGQGGMGVVYRARQMDLDRIVALKILRNPFDDSADRRRLLNEAHAAARLQHPGIVQIHHVGEIDAQPYLCFEFIDGSPLGDRLARATMLPEDACRLLKKITNAVAFAHAQGIVHRDLKPANILIDSAGDPKVADFGLAKFLIRDEDQLSSDRLTQTGALLGTMCYMAPEQFTGISDDVDHRADIYGLGTILYEMLVGRPPLIGNTPEETMYLVCTTEPTSPRKLNSKVPRDVETICLKCLEKNPDSRFQTASELEAELARYLAGEPLANQPASSLTVAARWCKRRPAIALLSGLSAILVIALAIGGYWMAWNQKQHSLILQEQRDLARVSADLAVQKADEADKATQFMVDTLGSAHPDRDGRNVTVAERLADGLNDIDDSYSQDSTGKAALLSAIGKTYFGLGMYLEAIEPLEQAWQLFLTLQGAESAESLQSELQYANGLKMLGRYELAEKHIVHSQAGLVAILGSDSPQSIAAKNNLADVKFLRGDRQPALDIYEDSYHRAKASFSPQNKTTIQTTVAYADALMDAGKFALANDLVTNALPIAIDFYGQDDLLVINLEITSARIARADGEYELALGKYKQIHEGLSRKLGPDHVRTISSLNGIAMLYADLGNNDKAAEITQDIRSQLTRVLGAHHPQTLHSVLNVAKTLEKCDRRNEARLLLQTTFERVVQTLGRNHPQTMMIATHYGCSLAENDQLEEAEVLLADAVNFFRTAPVADPITRAEPFIQLGSIYKRTNRIGQAVELYETALEIAVDAFGELAPMTLSVKNNLATAYSRADRTDEAISTFQEVLNGLRQKLGEDHPHTLGTALNLAIIYRDENRSGEAVTILSDVVPIFNRQAAGSWLASRAQFQLGRAFLDIGEIGAAQKNLETAFLGFERLLDQQPARSIKSLANQIKVVGDQFNSLDEIDLSETWLERRASLMKEQTQSSND